MSREGDLMRQAFKHILAPALGQLGFVARGAVYQRCTDRLDLLDIQYWKYGGEFILEFGRLPRGDLRTSWGETVPEEKIKVTHISPLHRARLEQRGADTGAHLRGFSFSGFGEDRQQYEALARQVASLLPQVDTWLQSGSVGSHIHSLGTPLNT